MDPRLLDILVCPVTKAPLVYVRDKQELQCKASRLAYPVRDGIPQGVRRIQTPHLYQIATQKRIDLGYFVQPPEYNGESRCDSHPRSSRDERLVCIDAPDGANGRQLHLIDISGLMGWGPCMRAGYSSFPP